MTVLLRRLCALALLLALAAPASGQADRERKTLDGDPLPAAEPILRPVELPMLGKLLGSAPDEATGGRIWSIGGDTVTSKMARRAVNDLGVDATGYQYVAKGQGGALYTLLAVEGGRVNRVALIDPKMTDATLEARVRRMAEGGLAAGGAKGEAKTIDVDGVRLTVTTTGGWSRTRKGESSAITGKQPDRTTKGPGALVLAVTPADWVRLRVSRTDEMYRAARDGKLAVGMSKAEAYATMAGRPLRREERPDGTETWYWLGTERTPTDEYVVSDQFGTTVSTRSQIRERVIATATFNAAGVVESLDVPLAGEVK